MGWSLSERYGAGLERVLASLPGFRVCIRDDARRTRRAPPSWLSPPGASAVTAELIRNQAEPTDEVLGRALLLADQAN